MNKRLYHTDILFSSQQILSPSDIFPKKAAAYSCNQEFGVFYVQRKASLLSPNWSPRELTESCTEEAAELGGEGISFISYKKAKYWERPSMLGIEKKQKKDQISV